MSSPWADQPYSLIATQPFSKDTSHAAYYVATQMALAHNGILRGLNAIYIQAPYIPKDAVQDFLTYCQCWCESMHHHHDGEEENFFPNLEKVTGTKGLMERNVEQHRAFTPGFEAFQEYANECRVEKYVGSKVRSLIEAFAEPLKLHLHEEIDTLRALDKFDSAKIRQAYKDFEKIVMAGDSYRLGPLVFGTSNREFEGGMHNFPPVPFFVPYVIHYVLERRYRGAWRFNPCTSWGSKGAAVHWRKSPAVIEHTSPKLARCLSSPKRDWQPGRFKDWGDEGALRSTLSATTGMHSFASRP